MLVPNSIPSFFELDGLKRTLGKSTVEVSRYLHLVQNGGILIFSDNSWKFWKKEIIVSPEAIEESYAIDRAETVHPCICNFEPP